jgi:septum formation protein
MSRPTFGRQRNGSHQESSRKVPPPLILASASPARRGQLESLGLRFESVSPEVDEDAWKVRRWPARTLAKRLAVAKAVAVFERRPGSVVIGGDQVATLDGEPFDKPGDVESAKRQLQRLRGRRLELSTAVAVAHEGGIEVHVEPVLLTMRNLGDEEIEAYIEQDQPFDCAGCFRWESRGPLLFTNVSTDDPTAILGLPILWLSQSLRQLGYRLP